MLRVCLARALGWMLLAVTRGFQTLLGFPPHLQGGGSRWAKPGDGESCAMTWESHLRELGCKEDFPVNFPSSGTGQCSFWLPPGPCSTSISSHIADLSRRCFLAHNREWQPWRWRGTSRGAAGPFRMAGGTQIISEKLGTGRARQRAPRAGCWCSEGVTSPWAKLLK